LVLSAQLEISGQRILAEALSRGHYVTAFTRELSRIPEGKKKITWKSINVFDSDTIAAVIGGLDLLVSTYQPGNAAKNFNDVVEQSIRNPETYVTAAKALLQALEQYPPEINRGGRRG